jgi:hypothetical protein
MTSAASIQTRHANLAEPLARQADGIMAAPGMSLAWRIVSFDGFLK